MSCELNDKVVMITGANGRLGKVFCEAVLKAGGRVLATDVHTPPNPAGEERLTWCRADITEAASLDKALAEGKRRFGKVDALVNAAYPRNANYGRRFEEVGYADFKENTGLHAGGYFLACQRAVLFFRDQGHGNIVNLSSIYGSAAPRFGIYEGSNFTMPVEYAMIKAGIEHLTRYVAAYCKGQSIRCNTLSPGGIRDGHSPAFLANYGAHAAGKGMLDPGDIAGTLLFLLSDASAYVNGQNIVVDDGWTL